MKILVIDGQGGKMGAQLVRLVKEKIPSAELMAVGTNSMATSAMIKGGATYAATGENAFITACRKADIITGPVGIVIADSLFGEISAKMAVAAGGADAVRVLVPVNRCGNVIAGIGDITMAELLCDAANKIAEAAARKI